MENRNSVTNAFYSVSNQKHLEEHREAFELSSVEWAGFKQWKEKGRKVKKGAKGCKIFMVCEKKLENVEIKKDEKQTRTVMKALYVFNFDHTEEI
jgi:antirestriction protein ArdC